MQDEATLRYHFSKMGREGWQGLLNGGGSEADQALSMAAWEVFTAPYRQQQLLHPKAVADLAEDLRQGTLPRWALAQYEKHEVEQIVRQMRG